MADQSDGSLGGAGWVRLAPRVAVPEDAIEFSFIASGGPGGQNVNKRATKARLRVALAALPLSGAQAARLAVLASMYLTDSGDLVLACDETRSAERNRDLVIERLSDLVRRALVAPKVRRATRPTKGSQRRRIEEKKRRGAVKRDRRGGE